MGFEADRMMEDAAEWADFSEWCPKHRIRYLPHLGGCLGCEDGDPAAEKQTMFENGNDQTIRQLVERIEEYTGRSGLPLGAAARANINDWARQAIAIMDRLTGNEDAWAEKYAEAKDLGFSDGDAEAAADHEVGRTE